MKIKRIITAILLCFVLIISLSACDDNDGSAGTSKNEPSDNPPSVSGSTVPSDFKDGWEGPHVSLAP